ncbi:MAG TPA: uroporphyrinogen-III synthase [Aestuariivirga sp.]|nr:uroporphyrinogen-III synthase [Aestuariivirga sp.]
MKLLVTRPEEDARALIARLEGLGHEAEALPLLDIVSRTDAVIPEGNWQAVVATSANALKLGSALDALKFLPMLCVGPQTAAFARHEGFVFATAQGGDLQGLSRHILKHLRPEHGPLLYLSGVETAGDLAGLLKKQGFSLTRVITYDAVPRAISGAEDRVNWAEGVLLYSPRTARVWVDEVKAHGLSGHVARLPHFCISANVAANLPPDWPRHVATAPNEGAMLELLEPPEAKD